MGEHIRTSDIGIQRYISWFSVTFFWLKRIPIHQLTPNLCFNIQFYFYIHHHVLDKPIGTVTSGVLFAKVFSTKLKAWHLLAKGSNPRTFLSENCIFHQFAKVFSLDIFPLYGTYKWRGLHSTVSALSLKVSLSVFNLSNFLYINIWCPDRQWDNQTNNVLGVCCVTTQTKSLGERTKSAVIKF